MTDYAKENRELSDKAQELREDYRLATGRALAAARKCRKTNAKPNEEIPPEVKAEASQFGKQAAERRREYRAVAAEAATARRVACFKAMPAKPVPEIDPATLPKKPPIVKRCWEED